MAARESLHERRERLGLEWSRWVDNDPPETWSAVRSEVIESWRRSLTKVSPHRPSAPTDEVEDPVRRWRDSPLRQPVLAASEELRSLTDDSGFVAAVTDESGTVLWTCGARDMRRVAERVNFVPGGRWNEDAMGTNALSLALRTGTATSVFSAEHLVHALHGCVCYCAPLRGPDGSVLGVLDLSSTWDRAHPMALPAPRTLAGTIESHLAARLGTGRAIIGHGGWSLACLGEAGLTHNGVPVRLRPRQLEILTLLVLEGRPLSPEYLREALYGDRPVTPATLKAEVCHLRRALQGALSTRRYELTDPVGCDAVDVLAALQAGRTAAALEAYRGPLLPDSDAPGIAVWREHVEVALREAVLRTGDPGPALHYGELRPDDVQVHERALALLGDDPRRGIPLARLRTALTGH